MTDLLIACEISDWFSAQFLLDYFYHNASYMLVFLFMVIESSFLPFHDIFENGRIFKRENKSYFNTN